MIISPRPHMSVPYQRQNSYKIIPQGAIKNFATCDEVLKNVLNCNSKYLHGKNFINA